MFYLLLIFFIMLFKEIMENFICLLNILTIVVWVIFNILKYSNYNNLIIINMILLIILLFFNSMMLWKFFLFYEISMLPIIILLLSWGNNPSRLPAALYMIIYMVIFSFPSMVVVIKNLKVFLVNLNISITLNLVSKLILIFMFLVKIPLFTLHYWLPKAHTEASTFGSMVLASGLLKMGGIGLWKIMKFLQFKFLNYFFLMTLTLISSLICLMQTDMKKLVALMSVFHMTLSVTTLSILMYTSFLGFVYINLTHIMSSSILFYFSGYSYSLNKTRLLFMMKITINSKLFIFLSLMLLLNMGIPPFFTFFVEIINLSQLFYKNYWSLMLTIFILIAVALINLFFMSMMNMLITKSMKFMFFINFYYIFMMMFLMWLMV
uniref:NADH-ubiquinone oxidoreductase chain 4 n=1 Tax=Romanomermis iyengari TaxID=416168 RepID=A1Z3B1_ROMIY|nr:NADH dehydrogenase subunit 4 [Romanomermis iyengari]ABL73794.1 NADH dehydrogenase subunit 4 [Romanomermis iyengari]